MAGRQQSIARQDVAGLGGAHRGTPTPPNRAPEPGRIGRFIALEGGDGAGRSSQVRLLLPWLEAQGWAPVHVGLGRGALAQRALRRARRTPGTGVRSLALLYAADMADQGARQVAPALDAGFVVIADRWTATASARCLVRGAPAAWLASLLAAAPEPDLTLWLRATPRQRLAREVAKQGLPDFTESGRDMGLDPDPLKSFLRYQGLLDGHYAVIGRATGARWHEVDAGGPLGAIQSGLRRAIGDCLAAAGLGAAPATEVTGDG